MKLECIMSKERSESVTSVLYDSTNMKCPEEPNT